MCFVVCKTTLE
jgi:histidinol-phosphate/aromatic aminotransferase/cobyric acid decarboxylase-like protein